MQLLSYCLFWNIWWLTRAIKDIFCIIIFMSFLFGKSHLILHHATADWSRLSLFIHALLHTVAGGGGQGTMILAYITLASSGVGYPQPEIWSSILRVLGYFFPIKNVANCNLSIFCTVLYIFTFHIKSPIPNTKTHFKIFFCNFCISSTTSNHECNFR